eukprot:TRINITY_DN632_c0_g1_i6.p1 TRINITY_DN632_c0_g1~~TRINITY_DN632_c0_g1_i6.p1  ORF type:complete len:535 (+),score=75.90 TRINITY_DN632_c0_g1_i6:42-1607(+)
MHNSQKLLAVSAVAITLLYFLSSNHQGMRAIRQPSRQYPAVIPSALEAIEQSLGNYSDVDTVFDYRATMKDSGLVKATKVGDIMFASFAGYQCENAPQVIVKGSQTVDVNGALERCTKHPLCHSVSCTDQKCVLNVAACVLKRHKSMDFIVHVWIQRTPKRLYLLEKFHADLIPIETLRANRTDYSSELPENMLKKLTWNQPELAKKNTSHEHDLPFIQVTRRDLVKLRDPPGYVDPVNRIVLFVNPKAASTGLRRLYDRMIGHEDTVLDVNSTIEMHHRDSDITRERIAFDSLNATVLTQLMNDKRYKKVIFFRDPATRLLSCYFHLFLLKSKLDEGSRETFSKNFNEESTSWEQFVSYVSQGGPAPYGTGPMVDPHYRQQVMLGNLYKFLPLFDFIGWANGDHIRKMLEKYDLWEKYGATGWGARGGFMQESKVHQTGASKKSEAENYFDEEKMEKIKYAYSMDYAFHDFVGLKKDGPPTDGYHLTPYSSVCGDRGRGRHWRRPICWPGEPVVKAGKSD